MRVFVVYDKNGNKFVTKKNKSRNGIYFTLSEAKLGVKLGVRSLNKRLQVKGRYELYKFEDYIIKEFELTEKSTHPLV